MRSHRRAAEGPVQQHDTFLKGRHLCAGDHVSAGHRILQEEAAAAVLYDDCVASRCHMSFREVQSLMRCGGCKFARYASRDSQRLAWQLHHREECVALQACNPKVPPPSVRLVAQLFWRRGRCHGLATSNTCWQQLNQDVPAGSNSKKLNTLTSMTLTAWSITGATCQTARSSCMPKWLL